jgi:anti-sigma factor RsiW
MNCEIARRLMDANDPGLAAHLRSCPSCMVSMHARYYEAPPALAEKIRQNLRADAPMQMPWKWLAIAASIMLAVSVAWNLRSRPEAQQLLAENVLSAHLRSLNGTHLLDVPSSDQHTVKPWFAGKLEFSPPVKDVDGFPLLGGRLEYFDGHPAAALVYGRRMHIVNLFVWPAAPTAEKSQERNGYRLRSWSAAGMTFWAVSDLNDTELTQFVSAYRSL